MTIPKLLPEFEALIANLSEPAPWSLPIRPDTTRLSEEVQFVENVEQAEALLAQLNRLSIGAIAIDTEFRFRSSPVELRGGRVWQDPTTLVPLLLSAAAWVPEAETVIRIVIDLRREELRPFVDRLLRIHAVYVAHHVGAEFKTLWKLGLQPAMAQLYDTYVVARALTLGSGHRSIELLAAAHQAEDIEAVDQAQETLASHLSLVGQCAIYGIKHQFAVAKDFLRKSFLTHNMDAPFSQQQIDYAAADAEAALRLYLAQQRDVIAAGLYPHLVEVEFPFAEANARMEWDGVPVSRKRLAALRHGLDRAVALHRASLNGAGLENPNSNAQVLELLQRRGHGDRLFRNGAPTTADEILAQIEPRDELVKHLRRFRRYSRMLADPLFEGSLIGSDERLHPDHRHLAAGTGRSSCSAPNIVGITKTFRPVVAAGGGRAIIELDYAQIEVGICAAEHDDDALIAAYNSGDVYAAVAQQFYARDLTDDERRMSPSEFKKARSDLRDKIKIFVLAVLYNMQAQAVADRFAIPVAEAERQREAFLNCYPAVRRAMVAAAEDGRVRGYAAVVGGLRRHIPRGGKATNQLINTPVQGSAGVVFRQAVVRLYEKYRGTTVRLLLPVHDAVVLECDSDKVEEVSQQARQTMIDAVRKYYPKLFPRVDINCKDPSCWNKDGLSDSLERFLADPMYKLG